MRHRQLLTVFALSVRHEAADVSLAVSCGILPRLMHMHDAAVLSRRSSSQARLNDIGCVLATASMHLLQILAITARYILICLPSSVLYGSETWPVRKENEVAVQRAEMRMVRWMCGVKIKDRVSSKELRERLGIVDIMLVLQQNTLWTFVAKGRQ